MIRKEFRTAIAHCEGKEVRFERLPSGSVRVTHGKKRYTIAESDWVEIVLQVSIHANEEFTHRILEAVHRG